MSRVVEWQKLHRTSVHRSWHGLRGLYLPPGFDYFAGLGDFINSDNSDDGTNDDAKAIDGTEATQRSLPDFFSLAASDYSGNGNDSQAICRRDLRTSASGPAALPPISAGVWAKRGANSLVIESSSGDATSSQYSHKVHVRFGPLRAWAGSSREAKLRFRYKIAKRDGNYTQPAANEESVYGTYGWSNKGFGVYLIAYKTVSGTDTQVGRLDFIPGSTSAGTTGDNTPNTSAHPSDSTWRVYESPAFNLDHSAGSLFTGSTDWTSQDGDSWYHCYIYFAMRGMNAFLFINGLELIDQGTSFYPLDEIQGDWYPYAMESTVYYYNLPDLQAGSGDWAGWEVRFGLDVTPRDHGWLPEIGQEYEMSRPAEEELNHTGSVLRQLAYGGSRGPWPLLTNIVRLQQPFDFWLFETINTYAPTGNSTFKYKDPTHPVGWSELFSSGINVLSGKESWFLFFQDGTGSPTPTTNPDASDCDSLDAGKKGDLYLDTDTRWAHLAFANTDVQDAYIDRTTQALQRLGYAHLYMDTGNWNAPLYRGEHAETYECMKFYYVNSTGIRYGDGQRGGAEPDLLEEDTAYLWRKKLWGFIKRCSLAFEDYAGITVNLADTTVVEGVRYDEDPGDEPSVVGSTGSSQGGGRWLLPFLDGVLYEHAWIFPTGAGGQVPSYTKLSRWEQRVRSASQFGRKGMPLKVIYMSHTPYGSGTTDEKQAARDAAFAYNMASVLMAASYGLKNVYWAVSNTDNGNQELSYHYPVERYTEGGVEKGWRLGHPKAPWYWHSEDIDSLGRYSGLAVAWYENGIVLVYPFSDRGSQTARNFTIPRTCRDVNTGTVYSPSDVAQLSHRNALVLSYI